MNVYSQKYSARISVIVGKASLFFIFFPQFFNRAFFLVFLTDSARSYRTIMFYNKHIEKFKIFFHVHFVRFFHDYFVQNTESMFLKRKKNYCIRHPVMFSFSEFRCFWLAECNKTFSRWSFWILSRTVAFWKIVLSRSSWKTPLFSP